MSAPDLTDAQALAFAKQAIDARYGPRGNGTPTPIERAMMWIAYAAGQAAASVPRLQQTCSCCTKYITGIAYCANCYALHAPYIVNHDAASVPREWISIDAPPRYDVCVLVYLLDGSIMQAIRTTRGFVTKHAHYATNPTHWMPLPASPLDAAPAVAQDKEKP